MKELNIAPSERKCACRRRDNKTPSAAEFVNDGKPSESLAGTAHAAKRFALAARGIATERAYASDWNDFETWCSQNNLSSLPAEGSTVALYITSLAEKGRKVATINRRLISIASTHRKAGQESPCDRSQRIVRDTMRGIRRTLGTHQRGKCPMTINLLRKVLSKLDTNFSGSRDRALILVGFAGGMRRSELASIRVENLLRYPRGITVLLPSSKTDQEGEGREIDLVRGSQPLHTSAAELTCPVRTLDSWLSAAGIKSGPVFRHVTAAQKVRGGLTCIIRERPASDDFARDKIAEEDDDSVKLLCGTRRLGDVLDRFIAEEHLLEIKARRPGERAARTDELAYSTTISYLSLCNRIREKWGAVKLDKFRPLRFQNWLKDLDCAPKYKGHLKAFMHRLLGKAKLYGMTDWVENPIDLVEVRGISKRRRKPADITIEQFWLIFNLLKEPYSTMILLAQCTGLRVDELLALRWSVFDFERLCMEVKEGVVCGRIGPVKSEYSEDELPLDPDLATIILMWKRKSQDSELVFPSPKTGWSYHASPIQQDWIRRAGWCLVACPECGAKPGEVCTLEKKGRGKKFNIPVHDARHELATKKGFGSIGWHTFRHTYRSLLSEDETPLDVQQKLMRHAHLSTTGDYGGPPMENRRQANSAVTRKILLRQSTLE